MRKIILNKIFLLIGLALSALVSAQEVRVNADLKAVTDNNKKQQSSAGKIMIGDQVELSLSAEHPKDVKVQWPMITDSIGKLEVVGKEKLDTISAPDAPLMRERKSYLLTTFDTGSFVIPSYRFAYRKSNDTANFIAETKALMLQVNSPKVDTTQAIKDIKSPLDIPFTWREAAPYIAGALLLAILGYIAYRIYQKRKQGKPVFEPSVPLRPAHEIALEALEALEKEKLWQAGHVKQYYSRVADVLRVYIESRFKINAMEQTSDETLSHFRSGWINDTAREELTQVLRLSDLVKFAKYQPVGDENILSLRNAYEFIHETRPTVSEPVTNKTEA